MRKITIIGEREFKTKKDALSFYKEILNSYDFGQILNEKDTIELFELLKTHPNFTKKIGAGFKEFRVTKSKYNTKVFEIVRQDNSADLFSYIHRINSPESNFTKFGRACRKAIQEDMWQVKKSYFDKYSKKGKVKCQETNELLLWEELNVDHRQPNTFSVILDRFIELNQIDIKEIEYNKLSGQADELADNELANKFRDYHRQKANLRIVKKDINMGRSFQGRVNRQKKDLTIK
ncbi:DCL family protein [Draconibacterium orientale]|uniref:DCL family protein n=1 Tax=Draconibacterium orientale TaxID=1168034 RepID=UPI002ABD8AF6|nr:DCL family protein [Draconibacterium orientale]